MQDKCLHGVFAGQRCQMARNFLPRCISLSLLRSPRSELTVENLEWLENVFRRSVGDNGEIRLQDFKNIVHSKNVSEDALSARRDF